MGWTNLSFMRLETYITMNKPELEEVLTLCFSGALDVTETFDKLEHLIDVSKELKKIKKALEKVEIGCAERQEKGWMVDGFVPKSLGKYIEGLK